jgi:DegV family protein with EDD domain
VSVAVVTDSSAYLPDELLEGYGIHSVPLYVVLAGRSGREGWDISPGDVARALSVRGQTVSTSRPTPGDFVAAYRKALDGGAERLVSIHLSSELSGTWDAARLAAQQVGEHVVTVVDTRSAAMGAGFAVLAAARSAATGVGADVVAKTAREIAAATRTFFVVDTLEYLRRGGRIGSAQAWLGSALQIKPILTLEEEITPVERVRTRRRAFERMVEFAHECKADGAGAWVVQHIHDPDTARALVDECRQIFGSDPVFVSEIGPVIGAHAGPGLIGVTAMRGDLLGPI